MTLCEVLGLHRTPPPSKRNSGIGKTIITLLTISKFIIHGDWRPQGGAVDWRPQGVPADWRPQGVPVDWRPQVAS